MPSRGYRLYLEERVWDRFQDWMRQWKHPSPPSPNTVREIHQAIASRVTAELRREGFSPEASTQEVSMRMRLKALVRALECSQARHEQDSADRVALARLEEHARRMQAQEKIDPSELQRLQERLLDVLCGRIPTAV